MKKFLLLILAVSVIGGVFAQNKYASKDLRKATAKNLQAKLDLKDVPMLPFVPRNLTSSKKALTSKSIGTSANVYTLIATACRQLAYDPEINTLSFIHRRGGPWGGTSGQLFVKTTQDFFTTKDSFAFTATSPNLFRYPSCILHNPAGNTDATKAYAVICGPCTDGAGWINNFYGSQKLDHSGTYVNYVAQAADTFASPNNGLCGGHGKFHVMHPVILTSGNEYLYYRIGHLNFNNDSNRIDYSENYITPLMKKRVFSNATVNWDANQGIAFDNNGIHGYVYSFGADSMIDPDHTGIPIVWETWDAGNTWTKQVYEHFRSVCGLTDYIWPTLKSLNDFPADPSQWVFRPDFVCGASGNEGDFPSTVDANGYLHIATIVEGRYSADPDSLDYTFANHPTLLFDVYKVDTAWRAILIDTIRTDVVDAANSGFGTGTDATGWDHWIKISKSADGNKIFVLWTETDPTIDTTNIMPEVMCWGVDFETNMMTAPTKFETGGGNIFYMQTSNMTVTSGSTFKVPVTYIDIYESGPNPLQPQKHYFLDGVQFDQTDFNVPLPLCSQVSVKNLAQNTESVSNAYPNPATGSANFTVTLKETSTIDVFVTNVLGQIVYKTSKSNATSGVHTFSMDTRNWNNGVYFYTVATGKNKITRKLIVE